MEKQLSKLASCIAYSRRSLRKFGLEQIAVKLSPVLMDLRDEITRMSVPAAGAIEASTQTALVHHHNGGEVGTMADCDEGSLWETKKVALPYRKTHDVGCLTEEEVLTRTQFESIMQNVQTKYVEALERVTTRMQEQMHVIQSLEAKNRQPSQLHESAEQPCLASLATSLPSRTMNVEMLAGQEEMVDEEFHGCDEGTSHLEQLREAHVRQRLALKAQRREERRRLQEVETRE